MRLHRRDRAKEKAVDEAKRLQAEATTARADEQQATEALAQTQEQLAAILEFNQEAEARGFGEGSLDERRRVDERAALQLAR